MAEKPFDHDLMRVYRINGKTILNIGEIHDRTLLLSEDGDEHTRDNIMHTVFRLIEINSPDVHIITEHMGSAMPDIERPNLVRFFDEIDTTTPMDILENGDSILRYAIDYGIPLTESKVRNIKIENVDYRLLNNFSDEIFFMMMRENNDEEIKNKLMDFISDLIYFNVDSLGEYDQNIQKIMTYFLSKVPTPMCRQLVTKFFSNNLTDYLSEESLNNFKRSFYIEDDDVFDEMDEEDQGDALDEFNSKTLSVWSIIYDIAVISILCESLITSTDKVIIIASGVAHSLIFDKFLTWFSILPPDYRPDINYHQPMQIYSPHPMETDEQVSSYYNKYLKYKNKYMSLRDMYLNLFDGEGFVNKSHTSNKNKYLALQAKYLI
jgi:hypothetical protein